MARRRWYLIILPAILGVAAGYGLVRVLPKRYTSQAMMLVEQQQVPNTYVEPIVTEDLNARIANIEEQTLSRTRLAPVIERYSLFKEDGKQPPMDQMIVLMHKAVKLTPVQPMVTTPSQTIPGFYLAVTLDNPRQAQAVCNDLTSMFVDEYIRQQEMTAQGTTNFLQSQLDDAKRKLNEQDAILADFEGKYMGALPDETRTNLDMLGTLNTQLEAVTENLNRAVQDQSYMQSVLAEQVQAWNVTREMKDGYVATPDTQGGNPLLDQLATLQSQLSTLRARYTDDFPDVIKVKSEISAIQKQIRDAAPATPATKQSKVPSATTLEPPEIQKLRGEIQSLGSTIKIDTQQQDQLKGQIAVYESRLKLSPEVEEEYKKITRDHDTAQKFYNSLLAKSDQSHMASELERRQEGEQLRVMDPASLPDRPSFPKPLLFIGGGFAGGLALGVAGVLGLEMSDKRIRSERDLQYYLGSSAFALIPSIEIAALRKSQHLKTTGRKDKPRKLIEAS